jgi:hypothetical protein
VCEKYIRYTSVFHSPWLARFGVFFCIFDSVRHLIVPNMSPKDFTNSRKYDTCPSISELTSRKMVWIWTRMTGEPGGVEWDGASPESAMPAPWVSSCREAKQRGKLVLAAALPGAVAFEERMHEDQPHAGGRDWSCPRPGRPWRHRIAATGLRRKEAALTGNPR